MNAPTRRVAGIVFDLDGTLIDSYAAIADSLNHARGAFGLPPLPVDDVRRCVGQGLENLIAEQVGPDRVTDGVARFRERYAVAWKTGTRALPGARESLARLRRRGYRLAVASNKPARFSVPILRHTGMLEDLDCVAGPDTVGTTKPDPAMIRHCLREIGVEAASAVYVGDMVLDDESGRRAGVEVVLVAGGSSTPDELLACGRPLLQSVAELEAWLER